VSRAFNEEKPIILFDKKLETKGLNQKEVSALIHAICKEIKSKNSIGIMENDKELVLR